MLKQRQKEVLFFLRGMEGYTSAEVIAGAMGCSVKTIRNDLQTIRDFLEERYHTTIVAKPNCGVRLAAGQDAWEKIQADFDMPGNAQKRPYDGNQEEWRDVAALLLRKTDVTLRDLEQMLYCSRSVAEKRLSEAQAWLEEQGLSVLRKRGMGIFLEGSEFCRTIALWRVWAMGLMALPGGWNSPGGQGFSGGVLQKAVSSFFSGFSPGGVEDVIVAVEKEHGLRFNFESYARLLFLTSFVLFQHRQKRAVEVLLRPVPVPYSATEERIAAEFLSRLEKGYQLRFSQAERDFLAFVLGVCEQEAQEGLAAPGLTGGEERLARLAASMVSSVGRAMSMDLAADVFLYESVLVTLCSIIRWNSQGLHMVVPGLSVLREQYTDVFLAVQFAAPLLEEAFHVKPSPQEISLLALHFAGALHRGGAEVHIAVMCNYGIGFSQLLKSRIERELVGSRVVAQGSMRDLEQFRRKDFDLLVSTVPLAGQAGDIPTVCVDPFLMSFDINLIKAKVEEIRKSRWDGGQEPGAARLFWPELCFIHPPAASKEELLQSICGRLLDRGMVLEGYGDSLLLREEAGSSCLKGGIAIPHGKPCFVRQSAIAAAVLKKPLLWDGTHQADIVFVLALDPEEPGPGQLAIKRFYRYFSALLGNSDGLAALRRAKNPQALAAALQEAMDAC